MEGKILLEKQHRHVLSFRHVRESKQHLDPPESPQGDKW